MIWKHYLKLSQIASYSKLVRASKAPPPLPPTPPGGIELSIQLEVPRVMGVLRAAISNEAKYACYMYTDCDKQIFTCIINSSNPVKVEM